MEKTIVNLVIAEMTSTTEDHSEQILSAYERATQSGKALLDTVFLHLTGWTLASLINKSNHGVKFEKDGLGEPAAFFTDL